MQGGLRQSRLGPKLGQIAALATPRGLWIYKGRPGAPAAQRGCRTVIMSLPEEPSAADLKLLQRLLQTLLGTSNRNAALES